MKQTLWISLSGLILGGCAGITPVSPWEKGMLAKATMSRAGNNNTLLKFKKHIYFSKEASKGGGGVSGGGCGCN